MQELGEKKWFKKKSFRWSGWVELNFPSRTAVIQSESHSAAPPGLLDEWATEITSVNPVCKRKQQILFQFFFFRRQVEFARRVSSLPGSILSAVCWDFRWLADVLMRPTRRPSVSAAAAAKKDSAVWFCFFDSKPLKRLCSPSRAAATRLFRINFCTFSKKENGGWEGGGGVVTSESMAWKETHKKTGKKLNRWPTWLWSWCRFKPTRFHVTIKSTSCSSQVMGDTWVLCDFILLWLFRKKTFYHLHLNFHPSDFFLGEKRRRRRLTRPKKKKNFLSGFSFPLLSC